MTPFPNPSFLLLPLHDALDEAGEDGRNPLVEMLARHAPRLPDWIGLDKLERNYRF